MLQKHSSLQHIWNAPPEKRYKNFIHTVADQEYIWLVGNESGELVAEENGKNFLCLWPSEAFAQIYLEKTNLAFDAEAFPIEITAFAEHLRSLVSMQENIQCMVFPTDKNATFISAQEILEDLNEELECYDEEI